MTEKEYPGLTVSIPLFFNKDESIDFQTLDRYIEDLGTQKHISAVYSMAYNTRYRMLSEEEVYSLNIKILELTKKNDIACYVGHPYIFDRRRLEDYLKEYFATMLKKLRDLNYDQSQAARRKDLTF